MAKGNRGGKRGGGNMPNQGKKREYSKAPNPFQITTLRNALGRKGKPMSEAEAWFNANPYFSENYRDFSENCQRCVMAYEMRRRGYDVMALPTYENDEMPINGNWKKALKNMTVSDVGRTTENATIKSIENQMAQWGEGSRAIIRIKWAGAGNKGHVFNCEYTNGKLHVYDVQSNQRKTGVDYLKEYLPYTTLSRTQLFRTDNADISTEMKYMVTKKK